MLFGSSSASTMDDDDEEEEGIEITAIFSRSKDNDNDSNSLSNLNGKDVTILDIWETLARCDGLTGFPLGAAVKEGDDCVIDWLACLVIFGCQRVALEAEKRIKNIDDVEAKETDFEFIPKPPQRDDEEDELTRLPPLPLPEVITSLTKLFQEKAHISESKYIYYHCLSFFPSQYFTNRIH